MSLYLGIDIGGTKIAGALVTSGGEVVASAQQPTGAQQGRDHILSVALNVASELLVGHADIVSIGVGSGGQIDSERGVVVSASDLLPGWGGTDLRSAFVARFGIPVFVDNDVNALALGELRFGAARGKNAVLFLALGTGIGGALLIDGKLHHGASHTGGELGHLLVDMSEKARVDSGGAKGTLEAYCSGAGLVQTWREITGDARAQITGREIAVQAQEDRGSAAAEAITMTGEYLGFGLASLANVFDPDLVVIGGGMAALGDLLLSPARRVLRERALPGPANCPVTVASLGEHASVIGAAALAM